MLRRLFGSTNKSSNKQIVSTAACATFENLEERRLMAAIQLPLIGLKIAKRQDVDGTALNSNRITIAFTKTVRLDDASLMRSFGYAEDLANAGQQRKVTVGMSITRDPSDGRVLTIITDRLIRKGSRIFIYAGAVSDTAGNQVVYDGSSADKTITFGVGQNKPRFTLSNRNWAPTDLSYFTNDVFTSAPATITASTAPNAVTVRANLDAFLTAKINKGLITAGTKATALALFDDPNNAPYIPSANMRAALASLYGTVGEPAIASYIGKTNVTGARYTLIDFDGTISASAPIGETKISTTSGRLSLKIRPTFAGEDFKALSAVLAHEAMHQDLAASASPQGVPPNSQDEEIIANAVQVNVYIQQSQTDGSFVGNSTGLVNKINEQVLAMLNSGDGLFPYGGIKVAPALTNNGNVFVGAKTNPGAFGNNTPVNSFSDWLRREYVSRGFTSGGTSGNAISTAILKNIVGNDGNFTTLGTVVQGFLDTRNQILTDVAYVRMAQLLKLNY